MTRNQAIDATPVDLVAGHTLARGQTITIATIGLGKVRLKFGGNSPDPGDPYLPLGERESLTLRVGEDTIWAWSPTATRLSITTLQPTLGPVRGREALDVSSEDYENAAGFILQVGSSGAVAYRPLDSDEDVTETFTAAGVVAVGGVPLLLRAVRHTGTTATGLVAGLL